MDGHRTRRRCKFTVKKVPRTLLFGYVDDAVKRLAIRNEEDEERLRRDRRKQEINEELLLRCRSKKKYGMTIA